MRSAFIGHFAPLSRAMAPASSAAGNEVQRQIAEELGHIDDAERALCYSMAPEPHWPRGPLVSPSVHEDAKIFIGYLNLPVIKHLTFSLRLLMKLLSEKPDLCVQYNSYLIENAMLLLLRHFRRRTFLAIVIQDIHVGAGELPLSMGGVRLLSERASLRLARRFDLIVPVSSAIVEDFGLPPERCLVFQGGVTDFALQMTRGAAQAPLSDFGVFAGALEPYNGIDRLVDRWLEFGIEAPLHVFGRGSLAVQVEQAARRSDRICFHGLQPQHVVLDWQRRARWNFCLRYSIGLNQSYFFPSKLFGILCAPGAPIANDFDGLPRSVRQHLVLVSDDLSDLAGALSTAKAKCSPAHLEARRKEVVSNHSWNFCVRRIVGALRLASNA